MSIQDLLEALDRKALFEAKETYKQDELTPVVINPPKGKSKPLPPQKGGKQIDVEVINTGPPEKSEPQDGKDGEPEDGEPEDGEDGKGEGPSKETKKTDKPGEGKGKKKPKGPSTVDSHEIMNDWSDNSEAKELAEKIIQHADQAREQHGSGEGQAGDQTGHFMDKLRGAHKPKIDWVRELKKKINSFMSNTSVKANKYSKSKAGKYKEGTGREKSKSYLQYLKDPRSHSGKGDLLFKGPYVKAPIEEVALIIALDTSGSIPGETVSKVFGEMDKIARNFSKGRSHGGVTLQGKVYFMTWDNDVQQAEEYKAGDWKKFAKGKRKVKGGGGTRPSSIFKYLNDHFLYTEEKPNAGVLNIIAKPSPTAMGPNDIVLPVKNGGAVSAPFVVIATDGYFFGGGPTDQDLDILYKDNKDKILYLIIDGTEEDAYPKNIINYESYRI